MRVPVPTTSGRDVEVALAELLEDGREVRHDARHDGRIDARRRDAFVMQQSEDRDGVLVGKALHVGRDAPRRAELLAVEDADGDVGIADVERQ